MARKARAILQEFYLSFRLEKQPSIFIDLRATSALANLRDSIETELFFGMSRSTLRAAK
jgi:hypothetical protein